MATNDLVPAELWEAAQPLLPPEPCTTHGGPPRVPHRLALAGILYVLRHGLRWRELPLELGFGSGSTCWRRKCLVWLHQHRPCSASSWPLLASWPATLAALEAREQWENGGMEAEWCADRANLRLILRDQPTWSVAQLAQYLGRSITWVKKWRQRLRDAPSDDEAGLHSQPRARKHPPPSLSQRAIERILANRDAPPAHLQRVPGPKAILYFLQQDAELQAAGIAPPRSTATIWQVLRRHGRIPQRRRPSHEPVDLPPPLTSWQRLQGRLERAERAAGQASAWCRGTELRRLRHLALGGRRRPR